MAFACGWRWPEKDRSSCWCTAGRRAGFPGGIRSPRLWAQGIAWRRRTCAAMAVAISPRPSSRTESRPLAADIAGLIAALGEKKAILIGHDWGATIVWNTALFFPDRVRAVAGLSVPHLGRGPIPRVEMFRRVYKDKFFYQLYFQTPGVAEAELEADVRSSLRKVYYWASGDAALAGLKVNKPADARLLDGLPDPQPFPTWLTEADLDYYTEQFQRGGFRGPLNRYRTSDIDFAQQDEIKDKKIEQPTAFIAGSLDPVLRFVPGVDMVEMMRKQMSDLRLVELIKGAGHWVQQERPAEVNAAIIQFLRGLGSA